MKIATLILGLVVILSSSCMSVRYVYDQPSDLQTIEGHSYRLEEHCLDYNMDVTPINQQRIENALHLNLRSMELMRKEEPDLIVKYFVKNEVKYFSEGCDDYYDHLNGGPMCIERISSYEEGTLVVDVIDVEANKVIWHGAAMGPTYDDRMKDPNKSIEKIVKELLTNFEKKLIS